MLAQKLLSAMAGGEKKLYVDDVFSATLYTGTGAALTIHTGIDLPGEGGLLWIKCRSNAYEHSLVDTARSVSYTLDSSTTGAQYSSSLISLNSNGFTTGGSYWTGNSGSTFVAHTFRKAPKFFDVVTYTGNGVAGRQISHALGVAPGMVIIKRTDAASDWAVAARQVGSDFYTGLSLNSTAGAYVSSAGVGTATTFKVGNGTTDGITGWNGSTLTTQNITGATYVAYLFAHDTSTDGIIQCGSYTGSSTPVNLGWEPQFLLVRPSSTVGSWNMFDSMRGMCAGSTDKRLIANLSNAESDYDVITPTATGFIDGGIDYGATMIYMAIRRQNKPPTSGNQVYNAIARTGTGAPATVTGVGFAPDLVMTQCRSTTYGNGVIDRVRGGGLYVQTSFDGAETSSSTPFTLSPLDVADGFKLDGALLTNQSGLSYINHCFKRAPGVMDVVASSASTVSHSLAVTPELIISKRRDGAGDWYVWAPSALEYGKLNFNSAWVSYGGLTANSSTFNAVFSGLNCIYYLFATKAGISKVGSYTGNGSSQTINCGFSTGARFVLIKRTDSTGDWYVWDTARGIISANDPHLSLNSTAAEVTTDDSIDPDNTGFIVNQLAATNINVTSATYVYLALA